MLRLYILRHAKTSWAMPGKTDFERLLNERGLKDLSIIARCMKEHSYLPDKVFASSSNRTRQTIEGIAGEISDHDFEIDYRDDLYSGSLDNYMSVLKDKTQAYSSLMIVGHNPTCESLGLSLVNDGEKQAMDTLAFKFPTGALAVIDLDVDNWADIGQKNGYLRDFVLPREIE